jgi:hypothetical protein
MNVNPLRNHNNITHDNSHHNLPMSDKPNNSTPNQHAPEYYLTPNTVTIIATQIIDLALKDNLSTTEQINQTKHTFQQIFNNCISANSGHYTPLMQLAYQLVQQIKLTTSTEQYKIYGTIISSFRDLGFPAYVNGLVFIAKFITEWEPERLFGSPSTIALPITQEITKLQPLLKSFFAYCKLIDGVPNASKLDLVSYSNDLNKNIVALYEGWVSWNRSNLNATNSEQILNVVTLAKKLISLNIELTLVLSTNHAPSKQIQNTVVISSMVALALLESMVAGTFLKDKWQPTGDLEPLADNYVKLLENLNLSYFQSTTGCAKIHEFYEVGLALQQSLPTLHHKNYWLTESYLKHLNQQAPNNMKLKLSLPSKLSTWWRQAEAANDYDSLLHIINLVKIPQLQLTINLIENLNKKELRILARRLQLETDPMTRSIIHPAMRSLKQLIGKVEMQAMRNHSATDIQDY